MAAAHLGAFLVMAMLCHGTLAADRPRTSHLTDFYLSLAIGGALGGVFNTLVAPVIFKSVLEYPIVLGAGILLVTFTSRTSTIPPTPRHWIRPVLAAVLAAIAYKLPVDTGTKVTIVWIVLGAGIVTAFSLSREPRRFGLTLAGMLLVFMAMGGRGYANVVQASRTFFGTYRVSTDAQHRSYTLFHGTTIHGRQNIGSHEPLTYYHAAGPIGQVFTTRPADSVKSVAVVGLGTGTLASYVKPGQHWVFYEIDPEVERIARDTRYFTHVSACGSACEIVIGDARLSMQHRDDRYDVIVLDAFSSDAIPIHLLTREAVGLYLSRLRDDGILAVHISNNHLNLVPVLAGAMRAYDLVGRRRVQPPVRELPDLYSSHWAVLARSDAALGPLAADKNWQPLEPREGRVWTDDFSNIWTAIQWRK
jgi:spermidine synthase